MTETFQGKDAARQRAPNGKQPGVEEAVSQVDWDVFMITDDVELMA